jgi:anti-sigma-K factor RskA
MSFRGLPANNPSESQYQLWIFDQNQDERYPIDGGVFDIGPDGEVIVPVTAKIRVREPTLFAITVEKPGGVVVSSRKRLVLAAKVPAG